jgi:hypothetical protein
MNRLSACAILFVALLCFQSCVEESTSTEEAPQWVDETVPESTVQTGGCKTVNGKANVSVAGVNLDLRFPGSKYQGDLLILHAWNDAPSSWCSRSRICSKAMNKGYRVIMPAMGKSLYCQQVYDETREDWKQFPTANFIKDTLIPALCGKNTAYCRRTATTL